MSVRRGARPFTRIILVKWFIVAGEMVFVPEDADATSCVVSIRISVEFDGPNGAEYACVYEGVVSFCLMFVMLTNLNRDSVIHCISDQARNTDWNCHPESPPIE